MRTLASIFVFAFLWVPFAHAGAPLRIVPEYYSPDLYRGTQQAKPQEAKVDAALEDGVDSRYRRTVVPYSTQEPAGTIVVDSQHFYLYFVSGDGTAIRYGIGVGRKGFTWHDTVRVGGKQKWPRWCPPPEMIKRDAGARYWRECMPGSPMNPLGARAIYLFKGNKDTEYRIHGTFEPWTIGHNVSSGCIRLRNADVVDLYARVKEGATVIVR